MIVKFTRRNQDKLALCYELVLKKADSVCMPHLSSVFHPSSCVLIPQYFAFS